MDAVLIDDIERDMDLRGLVSGVTAVVRLTAYRRAGTKPGGTPPQIVVVNLSDGQITRGGEGLTVYTPPTLVLMPSKQDRQDRKIRVIYVGHHWLRALTDGVLSRALREYDQAQ